MRLTFPRAGAQEMFRAAAVRCQSRSEAPAAQRLLVCVKIFDMKRSVATRLLKEHAPELKHLGVVHLYLFGSTARDRARDGSDVDLFFDHARGELGVYQLMEIKELAPRILGCRADIMTRSSLHPLLRERIEASAIRVF
jgi:uncharacterized protein